MDSINSFINQIKNSQTIAIFTHINPDGDTLGSATGLKNFITTNFDNKDVTLVVCSEIPEVFGFLPGIKDVVHYSKIDETTIFDLAIATDVAAKDRMGVALTFFEKAKSKINIDHHITNNEYGVFNYVVPEASSASEVVYSLIVQTEYEISQDTATCLYTGICTDTGNFKHDNTAPKVLMIAGELAKKGAIPSKISTYVYSSKPKEMFMLSAYAMNNTVFVENDKIAYAVITQKDLQKFGAKNEHAEGIVEQIKDIKKVEIAILFKEINKDQTKVSMRTKSVDSTKIAGKFGGGGHKFASGCTINRPYKIAVDKFIEEVRKYF